MAIVLPVDMPDRTVELLLTTTVCTDIIVLGHLFQDGMRRGRMPSTPNVYRTTHMDTNIMDASSSGQGACLNEHDYKYVSTAIARLVG